MNVKFHASNIKIIGLEKPGVNLSIDDLSYEVEDLNINEFFESASSLLAGFYQLLEQSQQLNKDTCFSDLYQARVRYLEEENVQLRANLQKLVNSER